MDVKEMAGKMAAEIRKTRGGVDSSPAVEEFIFAALGLLDHLPRLSPGGRETLRPQIEKLYSRGEDHFTRARFGPSGDALELAVVALSYSLRDEIGEAEMRATVDAIGRG